jgi:hypothetical protein
VFRRCLLKTLSDEMVLFKLIRKHFRIEVNIFGFIILLRFTRVGRKIFMNDVIFEVLKTLSHVLCSLRNPRKIKRDSYFFHLFIVEFVHSEHTSFSNWGIQFFSYFIAFLWVRSCIYRSVCEWDKEVSAHEINLRFGNPEIMVLATFYPFHPHTPESRQHPSHGSLIICSFFV